VQIGYDRVPQEKFGFFKVERGTAARGANRVHVRSDWGAVRCEPTVLTQLSEEKRTP
jgi:hypothetical protein